MRAVGSCSKIKVAITLGLLLLAMALPAWVAAAEAGPSVRIKDIARLQGDRPNQLTGLGLVIGLEGTGDSSGTIANVQMVANALQQFGVAVPATQLRVRNVAAVIVTADLPAFTRTGDKIDVTVSSFGDAKSLQGGVLLLTPLKAVDGEVYAVAQGPVSIGGFNASSGGSKVQKNHPTVGTLVSGAIVEKEVPNSLETDRLTLVLSEPDFTTAARLAQVVNMVFTDNTASAVDKAAVRITVPDAYKNRLVEFVAAIEELPVKPDAVARIVVNERTGTVVMGQDVRISTVAVAHGNLSIKVNTSYDVSQPAPKSDGKTVVSPTTDVQVKEENSRMMVLEGGANVSDLVKALNAIGASPRDIISILQAIKAAGALHGELQVI